jgi:hypothetical protein
MINVDFNTFATLPNGTIFSYLDEGCADGRGLYRKWNTIRDELGNDIDYFESPLVPHSWNEQPATIDSISSRWAEYDFEQRYLVFEPADIEELIKLITKP